MPIWATLITLGGQATRGVEDLSASLKGIQPEVAGDGVGGIVASHVLDDALDLLARAERDAVHRAGMAIDLAVPLETLEQGVDAGLWADRRQSNPPQLLTEAAQDGPLAKTVGDPAVSARLLQVPDAVDGAGLPPVRPDATGRFQPGDQTLSAEISQQEQPRMRRGALST